MRKLGSDKWFRNVYVKGTAQVNETLTASSNATVAGTLGVTGALTANVGVKDTPQTLATTGTSITAYGVTIMASTLAGTKNYKIPVPGTAGYQKAVIIGTQSGSSSVVQMTCTGGTITSTAGAVKKRITCNTSGMSYQLVGASTTRWQVLRASVTSFSTAIA